MSVLGGGYAALQGGGFATGNGHAHARCMCASSSLAGDTAWRRRPDAECATTCNLHDSRPCGGAKAFSLFRNTPLRRKAKGKAKAKGQKK